MLLPASEPTPFSLPDPVTTTRTMSPLSPTISSGGSTSYHDSSATTTDSSFLPIAAQFSSARFSSDSFRNSAGLVDSPEATDSSSGPPGRPSAVAARIDAYNALTRSGGVAGASASQENQASRPHQNKDAYARNSVVITHGPTVPLATRRASAPVNDTSDSGHSRLGSRSSLSSVANGPVTLPDDLEQVLAVISQGILQGHIKQVTELRTKYDEQFPLVRSLADVFTSHVSGGVAGGADWRSLTYFANTPPTCCTWSVHWHRWTKRCRLPRRSIPRLENARHGASRIHS